MKKNNSPVLQGLLSIAKKDKYRFHMPGHKGKEIGYIQDLIENLLSLDFTEIDGTDDLYNSNGILKQGMELLSKERNSKHSFYLTNGSTIGIMSSILALTQRGDSILLSKDCHKSVYNAIEINSLKPTILENEIYDSGLILPVEEDMFLKSLRENKDIKLVVLSRPNYYGICSNIENLSNYCNENNIYLLIDEAHGSHLKYDNSLPADAMSLGAHISINSFHKTLPSLTQTSVINLNYNLKDMDCYRILSMIEKIQSSSPSYIFMASIDIARNYMEEKGKEKLENLKLNIENFYNSINSLDWIKIPKIPNIYSKDYTRIILETKIPATYVENYLKENNIYIEMISKNILVLICTTEDEKEDFNYLSKIINQFNPLDDKYKKDILYKNLQNNKENNKNHTIPLDKSEGRKLKEKYNYLPSWFHILKKGDIISKDNIAYIKELISLGINVYTDFNKDINNLFVYID